MLPYGRIKSLEFHAIFFLRRFKRQGKLLFTGILRTNKQQQNHKGTLTQNTEQIAEPLQTVLGTQT